MEELGEVIQRLFVELQTRKERVMAKHKQRFSVQMSVTCEGDFKLSEAMLCKWLKKELCASATRIIPTNNEGGVVQAIINVADAVEGKVPDTVDEAAKRGFNS